MISQIQQRNDDGLVCPTFSSYSSDRLVEIARKVSDDFRNGVNGDNDLFEFSLSRADEPAIFPVFNRVICENGDDRKTEKVDGNAVLVPLKSLFLEERENRSSTSSLESEESETATPVSYCVWRRKSVGSSPSSCKKSKSTGSASSKRFRLRDLLLRRSNSDGKESYLFAMPKNQSVIKSEKIDGSRSPQHSVESTGKVTGKSKTASPAYELFYIQNRSNKEEDKRKSYLPYRKDILGFFVGLGRF